MRVLLVSIAALCAVGVSTIGAIHNVDDLVYFAQTIKDKELPISAKFSKRKHELMAMKLRMHAHHVRQMAHKIEDTDIQTKYINVANELGNLADHIEFLPVMDHTMKFEHPEKMLLAKAKHAELKGEMISMVGEHLNDERISALGEHVSQWAQDLKNAVKKSACQMEEEKEDKMDVEVKGDDYTEMHEQELEGQY